MQRLGGCESDHLALRMKLNMTKYVPTNKKGEEITNISRPDYNGIRESKDDMQAFHTKFSKALVENNLVKITDDNKNEYIDKTCELLTETAKEIATEDVNRRLRSDWFTLEEKDLLSAINLRNDALMRHTATPNDTNKHNLKIAKHAVRTKVKLAKTKWIDQQLRRIEAIDTDPSAHWDDLNQLTLGLTGHHKKATIIKMVDKSTKKKATSAKENAEIFSKHFEHNVFNRTKESAFDPTILDEIASIPSIDSLSEPPTLEEISVAVKNMKSGKSPGKNGIPPEAYKLWLAGETSSQLINIITQYWIDDNFDPDIFHEVVLKIIPKKGDLSDPNKWRGIALLDICSKIISSIIASRLGDYFTQHGNETQFGSVKRK